MNIVEGGPGTVGDGRRLATGGQAAEDEPGKRGGNRRVSRVP